MIEYEKIAALAIGLSEDELEKGAFEYKPDSSTRQSAMLAFKKFRQGQEAAHATRDEVLGGLRKRLTPSRGIIESLVKSTPKGVGKGAKNLWHGGIKLVETGGTPLPPGVPVATKNLLTRIQEAGMSAANPREMLKILKETAGDLAHHPGNDEYLGDTLKKMPYHL